MSQSLMKVNVHLVFSTKFRVPVLHAGIRDELHLYFGGILRGTGCIPIQVGGVEDHVHLLFVLSRTISMAKLVEDVKKGTTYWLRDQDSRFADFHWQGGYGAFSVKERDLPRVIRYIQNQVQHHKKEGYQDEVRRYFEEHNLPYDERYLWD